MRWIRRLARCGEWNRWFAWHPCWLEGANVWCWLEPVERTVIRVPGWGLPEFEWRYRNLDGKTVWSKGTAEQPTAASEPQPTGER